MKRRSRSCLSGLILLLALSLCGCGEKEKEPVTITVIHAWGGTGADHVAMRDIYDGFQKENPDIEVQMISMPAREEMLRKVEDKIMVGNMPDVITFSGMGQNTTYDFIVKNNMALDIMPRNASQDFGRLFTPAASKISLLYQYPPLKDKTSATVNSCPLSVVQ